MKKMTKIEKNNETRIAVSNFLAKKYADLGFCIGDYIDYGNYGYVWGTAYKKNFAKKEGFREFCLWLKIEFTPNCEEGERGFVTNYGKYQLVEEDGNKVEI